MAFNFFIKPQTGFGLDISSSSVKLWEFERKGKGLSVKGYSALALPKGLVNADMITDRATFAHIFKQAIEKPVFGHFSSKYAVVNLPETKSFVRVIQIPRMSEIEAESAIPFEAENFIPMPIDQVYLDWQKLSEEGDKINILIIASPKDFVDGYLGALEKSGIIPMALEVESQSCHRALTSPLKKETVLIVDMAESRSSLIMVEEGNLQFTSTIPIAGNTFTDAIAKSLGVSGAKAEMVKTRVGVANTTQYPNIKTALIPILTNLGEEIKNILKFHNEHSEKQVSKIILTGGTARLQHLDEYLNTELGLTGTTCVVGNPWENIANVEDPPLDPGESLSYTTAIGLGLRGIHYEG